MIKTRKLQLLSALFLGTLTLAGCKDECKDVSCVQGACVDGNCVCDVGYSGTDCSIADNAKFSGTYTSDELCTQTGTDNYPVTVAPKSGTYNQVVLTNLWNTPGHSVVAVLATNGTGIAIEKQDLGQSGYDLEATSGSVSTDGKTINLAYDIYIDDTLFLESCTATLTR